MSAPSTASLAMYSVKNTRQARKQHTAQNVPSSNGPKIWRPLLSADNCAYRKPSRSVTTRASPSRTSTLRTPRPGRRVLLCLLSCTMKAAGPLIHSARLRPTGQPPQGSHSLGLGPNCANRRAQSRPQSRYQAAARSRSLCSARDQCSRQSAFQASPTGKPRPQLLLVGPQHQLKAASRGTTALPFAEMAVRLRAHIRARAGRRLRSRRVDQRGKRAPRDAPARGRAAFRMHRQLESQGLAPARSVTARTARRARSLAQRLAALRTRLLPRHRNRDTPRAVQSAPWVCWSQATSPDLGALQPQPEVAPDGRDKTCLPPPLAELFPSPCPCASCHVPRREPVISGSASLDRYWHGSID